MSKKTVVVNDRKIISLVKKSPFTAVSKLKLKNTVQEVGLSLSKSTIKMRLTTRCTPLENHKNQKKSLELQKNIKKNYKSTNLQGQQSTLLLYKNLQPQMDSYIGYAFLLLNFTAI